MHQVDMPSRFCQLKVRHGGAVGVLFFFGKNRGDRGQQNADIVCGQAEQSGDHLYVQYIMYITYVHKLQKKKLGEEDF